MTTDIHCPDCDALISGDYMSADKMRRRFFAAVRDAHFNLPDKFRGMFPNAEILRKYGLIAVGHCDVMTVACGSKSAAPYIAATFRKMDPYCVVIVKGHVLMIYTARSMARRILLKPEFMDVAHKFADWLYDLTAIDMDRSDAATLEGQAA